MPALFKTGYNTFDHSVPYVKTYQWVWLVLQLEIWGFLPGTYVCPSPASVSGSGELGETKKYRSLEYEVMLIKMNVFITSGVLYLKKKGTFGILATK